MWHVVARGYEIDLSGFKYWKIRLVLCSVKVSHCLQKEVIISPAFTYANIAPKITIAGYTLKEAGCSKFNILGRTDIKSAWLGIIRQPTIVTRHPPYNVTYLERHAPGKLPTMHNTPIRQISAWRGIVKIAPLTNTDFELQRCLFWFSKAILRT